ncbi:hypothetical protein OO184_23620 [Photorhabdus sp. APURE]|uniref:hypothetical protein n=1 Tax=Photorhabdus aballayi TaxID=2991723 RepID=UPI00223CBB32|nr:hypothetical protein [Photorhabdus aballayi]MCW7550836.1 hypothetical protein [Photorhabdus aballayi]
MMTWVSVPAGKRSVPCGVSNKRGGVPDGADFNKSRRGSRPGGLFLWTGAVLAVVIELGCRDTDLLAKLLDSQFRFFLLFKNVQPLSLRKSGLAHGIFPS